MLVVKEEKQEEDWTGPVRAAAPQHFFLHRLCQLRRAAARLALQDNHPFSRRSTSNYFSSSLSALYPRIEQEDQEGHLSHLILGQFHHNYKV